MSSRGRTTVALLTPPGVGAIAVLRLEGPGAGRILDQHFHPARRLSAGAPPDHLLYGEFCQDDELIDDVLAVARSGEAESYDISTHGGVRVVERVMQSLIDSGAALLPRTDTIGAWPATTTLEAELWEALPTARTRRAVRFLLRQRTALPNELRRIADLSGTDRLAALAAMSALLAVSRTTPLLLDGATIAIVGPPNSGKSTLTNWLAGSRRAIVSSRAGTTLDWVASDAALEGVPVTLIDTPGQGIRSSPLNNLAAARAQDRIANADLQLEVFDGSQAPPPGGRPWRIPGVPALLVLNKTDLGTTWGDENGLSHPSEGMIRVSAAQRSGLTPLSREIIRILGLGWADEEVVSLFTKRQMGVVSDLLNTPTTRNLAEAIAHELVGERE